MLRRWPLLQPVGKVVTTGKMDAAAVAAMYASPWAYPMQSQIVQEDDETVDYLRPTELQFQVLDALHRYRWNLVDKPRQSKTSTIVTRIMQRDCMYIEGMRGLLVAEKEDTAKEVFEQMMLTHDRLPPELKPPLAVGTSGAVTSIKYWHGGSIKIQTSGGRSPGIGRGLGWLVITEFGESLWQKRAAGQLLPTVSRRRNARVCIESTPGTAGSFHEQMWEMALAGNSRFNPVFLEWWRDLSCAMDPTGFEPTEAELAYMARCPGMTLRNLAWRRQETNTAFGSDYRGFAAKYPCAPLDGWIGGSQPIIPEDIISAMLRDTLPWPASSTDTAHVMEGTDPTAPHAIFADPAGYGSTGDPSSVLVYNAITRRDVAGWTGREHPDRFARRLQLLSQQYTTRAGPPLMVVESNAAACIATLKDIGCPRLLWTDNYHPGWYATDKRIQESEARAIRMLRQGDMRLRAMPAVHQLRHYDGTSTRRGKSAAGVTHHFDLVRCLLMAADVLSRRQFTAVASQVEGDPEKRYNPGCVTIAELDAHQQGNLQAATSVFAPPPRRR